MGEQLPRFSSTERRLDLSEHVLGRTDQRTPEVSTPLVFDVAPMHAWLPRDLLQLTSANAGMVVIDLHSHFDGGEPTGGDTQLAQSSFNLAWSSLNKLVAAARGDTAMVTHLTTSATGDSRSLTEVFIPPPFTTLEGQRTVLQGGFTPVPQTKRLSYVFHAADFLPVVTQAHPRPEQTPGRHPALVVSVLPAGKGPGFMSSIPDLLNADLHEGAPATPLRSWREGRASETVPAQWADAQGPRAPAVLRGLWPFARDEL
ncbi:hypothetical protein LXT21_01175 [Myxococcus sp. K38C18041901]|uniref:hypothetical protein n=1 Tax=Myxococcus guangdongensis TaxID=2906760 RepID=UPI0020A738C5|nr:hypothetical protein [Myxococcus guangdongensis]MCP3057383.1 hypothetical protein [Myxococcus guangdongensis]